MANQKPPNSNSDYREPKSRDRRGRRQETQSIKQFLGKAQNASFTELENDIDEFEDGLPDIDA